MNSHLSRLRGRAALATVVLAAFLPHGYPAAASATAVEWMPVSAIRPGMRGEGRTVVRGVRVESFGVEVLSVVPGAGPAGDLVLIRATGRLIEQSGGIAAGMSGSPIFVNGKLVGAIGFGWPFADHSIGLVTPIADMLSVLPTRPAGAYHLPQPITAAGRLITDIAIARTPSAEPVPGAAARVAVMQPLARPLLVSGVSPRAAELLRTQFEPLGITPVESATGSSSEAGAPLVPGSAIGVQLARGDLNAVAIGTLTYRRGDTFVAFGHPLLNRGRTSYLLTPAVIHRVVPSASFPFKVGSAGAPVGIVTEDRRAAIGGRIGVLPPVVGVRVAVVDRDRGRTVTMGTQVVRDTRVGPVLVLAAVVEAVDRALDRVGEGTARVRLTLRGRGLDAPVVRENVFYHDRDIGATALLELPEALRLLFSNEFVRIGPVDVAVDVEVESSRQTATLTEGTVEPRARRGETVTLRVTLRPFQEASVVRTVDVAIPDGFPTGPATLLIRSGSRPVPEGGLAAVLASEPVEAQAPSAAAQLTMFAERDRNTDLVVELIPGTARFPDGTAPTQIQTVRMRVPTPWVVRGRLQLPITVEGR